MSKVTRLAGGQGGEPHRPGLHLREIPGEPDKPVDSVGQNLRAARLRRGDELGQISQALRIRKDYLEAIETDRADKLPGRTYAIGFVRAYAGYLGLDGPELVSRFKSETAGQAEGSPQVGPAPKTNGRPRATALTAFVVLLGALFAYGVDQLSPGPVIQHPATEVVGPAKTQRAIAERAPRGNTAEVAALSAPPKAVQPVPTGQVFGAKNSNVQVVIRARASTRVLVQGMGGKVYINRILHPGDVYRVPNLVGLSLTTPDGGAVTLELDGREAGAAGPPGRMTEALSLDPKAIADRNSGQTRPAVTR